MEDNIDVGVIYIIGNEEYGELESYNHIEDKFEGLIPNFFEKLSEKSGLKFEYLSLSTSRETAIKNNQADIISIANDEVASGDKIKIFTLGSGEEIYIGFTSIVKDDVRTLVTEAIQNITSEEKEAVIISTLQEVNYAKNQVVIGTDYIITIFIALIVIFVMIGFYFKRLKRKLSKEKHTDSITGYSNYNNFEKTFKNIITDEMRTSYCLVDMGIDLEHIESIFGYTEVEKILKSTASILSDKLKDNEIFCRKTDSSFLMLIDYISLKNLEERIAELYEIIQKSISDHVIEANFGAYFLNVTDTTLEKAMYYALQARKYGEEKERIFTVCNNALISKANENYYLEKDITQNLKKEEFIGYFQTIVDVEKKEVFAIEVLARWENEKQGFIKPKKFLKILEENNLVYELDILMLKNACELLIKLQEKSQNNIKVFCNFSKTSLLREGLLEQVKAFIGKYGVKPNMFGIVIAEDVFYNRSYNIHKVVKNLKDLGFKIVLDNFGDSIYSLQDLAELECDYIKLAPSMLTNIGQERKKQLLAELIKFARNLGMEIICENVETDEVEEILKNIDCKLLQGNLYSPALPLEELDFGLRGCPLKVHKKIFIYSPTFHK